MVASTRKSKRSQGDLSTLADVVYLSSSSKAEETPVRTRNQRANASPVEAICIGSSSGAGETPVLRGIRNKKKRSRVESDIESDEDYVSDTPLEKTVVPGHHQHTWGSLKSRSSPRQLFLCVSKLTARQRDSVCQMGFGELLGFAVDGIPVKLAHYVVDSFQPDRMRLKCRQQEVNIDATVVHKLFGIPCGGVKFSTFTEPDEWHPKLRLWRNRYPPNIYVSPSLIREKIQEDDYDDMFFFKVDFIMLFVTTMISSHGNGLCREEIPKCFTSETSFENIDWCDFMVTSLRTCKQKWRRSDPKSAFAGPLTFLTLLYVDSLEVVDVMNTPVAVRAMHHWSQELLTRRQDYEISHGGFGMGRLRDVTVAAVKSKEQAEIRAGSTGIAVDDLEAELRAAFEAMSELKVVKSRVDSMLSSLCARHPNNIGVVELKAAYEQELGVGRDSVGAPSTDFATPSKVITKVVQELSKQESSKSMKGGTLQGAVGEKHVVEPGDSSDSSEDGHWLFARHTPMSADDIPSPADTCNVPAPMSADDIPSTVDDDSLHKAEKGKDVGSPAVLKSVAAIASEDPLVADVGGSPGVSKTLAAELDAHRKRFGLSTIWIGSDLPGTSSHVHPVLSQPSFSLGLTQDMPAAIETNVTGHGDKSLSQPTFSLGLTQEIVTEAARKDPIPVEAAECAVDLGQPSFSLGLSQESVHLTQMGVEQSVQGGVLKNQQIAMDSKQDSKCVAPLMTKEVPDTSLSLTTKQKPEEYRGATKSMVARLPVVLNDRAEIPTTSTRTELLVWDFLFSTSDKTKLMEQAIRGAKKQKAAVGAVIDEADIDPTEHYPYVMFEDRYGFRSEAPFLQSLALGRRLYGSVVDAWIDVLNNDPLYRSAGGVRRLFLATSTIVDWMLKVDGDRNAQRVAAFRSGVSGAVRGNQDVMDLQSFDMVFVPVLEMEHYYVVVFDLKHEDICLLDNIAPRKSPVVLSDSNLYVLKSTPFKVKHMFVEYLAMVNHPKTNAMNECPVRPVVLPWKTYKNTSDCGIFVMRHMENYCGMSARFNCGFSLNGKRKQTQLDALRKRFAASILLSGAIIYKDRIWRDAVSI